MEQCSICRWYNGGHDADCPRELTPEQKERYDAGRRAGRGYHSAEKPNDPIYMFGWVAGDIAADEWWNS